MHLLLIRLYVFLLHFYPRAFRKDFGEEMKTVFAEAIVAEEGFKPLGIFLKEIFDLPGSIFSIYLQFWFRGGNMSVSKDYLTPSTRWQAFIGTLPFLAFGIARLLSNVEFRYPLRFTAPNLVFYGLALTGLLIGWIRGFPLWSYSYLGWSLVFAWWWTDMRIYQMNWGNRIWIPFGVMILIALLWTRSFDPIKKLFRDIWNDWTRLTLAMFAFGGFAGLIYDENHHPQLFWFMLASMLTISAGSWFFLRSSSLKGRVLAIIGGFVGAVIISTICDATWDFQTYYGRTPTVQPWYQSVGDMMAILTFWLGILFWPIIIALLHFATRKRAGFPK